MNWPPKMRFSWVREFGLVRIRIMDWDLGGLMGFFRIGLLENFGNCILAKNFESFYPRKKSRKFKGRNERFLRNYKILSNFLSQ